MTDVLRVLLRVRDLNAKSEQKIVGASVIAQIVRGYHFGLNI